MVWVVTEFVTEHSHKLSHRNMNQFLRLHRKVKDCDISQVKSLQSVGVTSQVMDHLVDEAGSYTGVGHMKKYLQNCFDAIQRSSTFHNSDTDALISYMTAKA
ncbi:hypothetical protein Ddye_012691 [Dipteronia dyeriana]|uniref:Uncharacterized protein n=1 Tax=Dipteronia dyeriana TaxID=168575 RepID=A0AAD9X4W8_9ROSI|nr:hypothetical protein Ddye_012691 [Dipteronia dyeriana]